MKPKIRKLLMHVNIIMIILTAGFMQVRAIGFAQLVTIKQNSAPLEQVLKEIRKQSGYNILYDVDLLKNAPPVHLDIRDASVEEAMEQVLQGQQLTYSIKDRTIIINKKIPSFLEKVKAVFLTINVRGKVLGEKGEPLVGATVTVKGTNQLGITGSNGEFYLPDVKEGALLIISFVGYETREIKAIKDVGDVIMVMKEDELTEVVINTGYQKVEKSQLTGAASTIDEEQYQQRVAVTGNFLESLEGKVPGLVYNAQSGELSIRGVSTFDAVKQPLIVLDGFPTEIDLRAINPNDIVSISVLRDAAAASIYGVRASNGVIIVETRRGKSGKPVFNLRGTYAIQEKPDFSYLNYADAREFVQLQKEYFVTGSPSFLLYDLGFYEMNPVEEILFGQTELSVSNPLLTQAQVDEKLAALGSYDNLKEYERLFYQKRQAANMNLDVSGGNERSTYMVGLNYINELSVSRRSENKQIMLNMANTYKFSERFHFDFKGTYANSKDVSGNSVPYSDFFPYERLADQQGNALPVALDPGRNYLGRVMTDEKNEALMAVGLYDMFYYPYRELISNTNTTKGSSVKFQGRLNARITSWLNLDIGGNFENQNATLDRLQLEDAYNVRTLINTMALRDPATGQAVFANIPQGNILQRTEQKISNYTIRGQLNLAHKFGGIDHDLSGILGAEQKKTLLYAYTSSFFGYDGQTLINKPINMNALNATSTPAFTDVGFGSRFRSTDYFNETEADRRFMSYYGQGTYIFKGKYIATGSFRIDQSNLFGVDPKYKNKPLWSAGLNWNLNKERFIQQFVWVDNLQVRAATGFNGNVPSSNNGPFLILSTALNTTFTTPLVYNDVLIPPNQSLRWETTEHYNLGFDYSFFQGRLSGSLDWYRKNTTDVFGRFDADPTTGFNDYFANTASIQNSGWEWLISSLNIKSQKFEWRTQLTASLNSNKVLAVKATEYANSQLITSGVNMVEGLPMGALYSYRYGGLNAMGQPYVLDRENNEKVLAFYGTNQIDVGIEDLIYNGTTTPKYVLGFNNQFSIGDFDLSMLFMYYGGHVMRVEQPNPNNIEFFANNPLKGSSNFWRKPGDEQHTNIPGYSSFSSNMPGYYQSYARYGYEYASQFVRKADYIRLRDLVLTYNADAPFLKKMGLSGTQFRFQAQNVFRYTFSGNDIDPEAIDPITGVRRLETQPFYSLTVSTNF